MHEISASCPICRSTSEYGAELIGRYTLCTACRNRFYIEVPPLGGEGLKPVLPSEQIATAAPAPATTLDDLLWDTQRGNRFVIQSLWRLEKRLLWQSYGIAAVAGLLVVVLGLLLAGRR
jgi:hypothetical protein